MSLSIALAGNPNSGKTTMFNSLTGASQYVGNWPGVTVEKKEGKLKGHKDVIIEDLPGIYSLSPYTPEERVSRSYLLDEKPEAILNLVDASNIERNLYLTTQLMELGTPMVIALNMIDIVQKTGDVIDVKALEEHLGCKIIETSAVKNTGSLEAAESALKSAKNGKAPKYPVYDDDIEDALRSISSLLGDSVDTQHKRWYTIKCFERDALTIEALTFLSDRDKADLEDIITKCEEKLDDDSESLITNARYNFIGDVVAYTVKKAPRKMTTSDKIDRIVTNRWLALPIFAVIMFLVYFISVTSVGKIMTDFVNDKLFGEWIHDGTVTLLTNIGAAEWLQSLIVDGIIAGVGAVLGFVPQMATLFLLLAILEDSGYMARIAFIMDKIFRRFGLSGKSFIPIIIGTGCSVPGVLAARTIENDRDRKITIMTTTFMPCSAKLPIIAMIAGALFGGKWWVAPSAYFVGIVAIICSGIILKKTKALAGDPAPFVMELPPYRAPRVKGVLLQVWDKVKAFVVRAGTIIFISTIVIWFLQSFNFSMEMVESDESMLAKIGEIFAPIFAPLGWGNWKATVATVTGLVAKEEVVSTFGILYKFGEVSEAGEEIWAALRQDFTTISAYSFLIFNLLCAPCFAAIGAIRREMNNIKWTIGAIAYQTVLAYGAAFVFYQIGNAIATGQYHIIGTTLALVVLAVFLYFLFRPTPKNLEKESKRRMKQNAA